MLHNFAFQSLYSRKPFPFLGQGVPHNLPAPGLTATGAPGAAAGSVLRAGGSVAPPATHDEAEALHHAEPFEQGVLSHIELDCKFRERESTPGPSVLLPPASCREKPSEKHPAPRKEPGGPV